MGCRLCAGCVQASAVAASQLFLELIRGLTTGFVQWKGTGSPHRPPLEGGQGVRVGEEDGEGARAEGSSRVRSSAVAAAAAHPHASPSGVSDGQSIPHCDGCSERRKEATSGGEQGAA